MFPSLPASKALQFLLRLLSVLAVGAGTAPLLAQCPGVWLPGDGTPGTDGTVYASTTWDPDGAGPLPELLVVGGEFSRVGSIRASNVAAYDLVSGTWSALGGGLGDYPIYGRVRALAVLPSGELVAAGYFTTASGVPANRIARWNGSTWAPLGSGLTGVSGGNVDVMALAVMPNGDLVAAGNFAAAGGVLTNQIARWNGSSWAPLGQGISGYVYALAVLPSGDLIAGGNFYGAGGGSANHIARWDGTQWNPLGSGILGSYEVRCLAVAANGDLFVGGSFYVAGSVQSHGVARWNGAAWSAVGGGLTGVVTVYALRVLPNGDVVAGGSIQSTASYGANLVRWNGSAWSTYAANAPEALCLALLGNGDVIVGGAFYHVGSVAVVGVARWNGTSWRSLGTGWDGTVYALRTLPNGTLVAGGEFTSAGSVPANRIAVWDGAWAPLGTGVSRTGGVARITSLATLANGNLVAGGEFTHAGGLPANNVALWNGTSWSSLGSGVGALASSLAVLGNGDVVVGGPFNFPGSCIARWNGTAWSGLGAGTNGEVMALLLRPNGDLIVGGSFTSASGVANTSYLARWDGSQWSSIGSGWNGPVRALVAMPNGDVIAGGDFTVAGGAVNANGVARWNGVSWSPLGTGVNGRVRALAVLPNGRLVAGGDFAVAPNGSHLAVLNGTLWSEVPTVMTYLDVHFDWFPGIHALASGSQGNLAVGGSFVQLGGSPVVRLGTAPVAYLTMVSVGCPQEVTAYGTACSDPNGTLLLWPITPPWLGTTCRTTTIFAPPQALGAVVLGFAAANTPMSQLHPAGAANCALLVSPDVVEWLPWRDYAWQWELAVPRDVGLLGVQVRQQVLQAEFGPNSQPSLILASNALLLRIGAF
jgi:hypothetical protein